MATEEIEYRKYLNGLEKSATVDGNDRMLRAVKIFQAYTHDYDLSQSPLYNRQTTCTYSP
ncbi:hypothetical protein A3F00_05465 [Candidatus Daviesbacteria bacterium RIFCSPHIGHO2_12_FULL_37_11]|uniref:Uncharacterized protein n=1 Tax=Candidatus Daviesbacteria bacterium RIFCSPHIGHO2_12_FULL_37_11 TaxID=1797777 RepID=A0A1F5KC89_9BACT|nr:MAG: hypothetical protein A3F00_05465 [Candidatus Daviesbacteria bacterium RIFCSPHIGHO2_12_FULL_37_11]OGE45713.1 MAG: hypothetical protein A3B39_05330 [Candidatus Daviesbacteria bacterium RIFCSPLOWO2_01_FULL_37_10]